MDDIDASAKRRRASTQLACDRCRKMKERCSGERPCARCLHLGRECVTTRTAKTAKAMPPIAHASGGIQLVGSQDNALCNSTMRSFFLDKYVEHYVPWSTSAISSVKRLQTTEVLSPESNMHLHVALAWSARGCGMPDLANAMIQRSLMYSGQAFDRVTNDAVHAFTALGSYFRGESPVRGMHYTRIAFSLKEQLIAMREANLARTLRIADCEEVQTTMQLRNNSDPAVTARLRMMADAIRIIEEDPYKKVLIALFRIMAMISEQKLVSPFCLILLEKHDPIKAFRGTEFGFEPADFSHVIPTEVLNNMLALVDAEESEIFARMAPAGIQVPAMFCIMRALLYARAGNQTLAVSIAKQAVCALNTSHVEFFYPTLSHSLLFAADLAMLISPVDTELLGNCLMLMRRLAAVYKLVEIGVRVLEDMVAIATASGFRVEVRPISVLQTLQPMSTAQFLAQHGFAAYADECASSNSGAVTASSGDDLESVYFADIADADQNDLSLSGF